MTATLERPGGAGVDAPGASMGPAAIICRGLTKRFGDVVALTDLDLEIAPGTVFGFLGPNGAGKTTTLRLLTGLAHATSGSATVAGVTVAGAGATVDPKRRPSFGYLDQDPRFYGWMRGRELLELVADLAGLRGQARRTRIAETLDIVGLGDAAERRIGGYSGGMRQRIGLAAALLERPAVLFLDEPVSALDPAGRHDLLEVIRGLRGTTTVFMSTHILNDVERVCDRVGILDRGRLIAEASIDDLLERGARPVFQFVPEAGQDDQVDALAGQLRSAAWTTDVELAHGFVRVHVRDAATAGPALLRALADAGIGVESLERQRPTLEDVFLSLVSEGRSGSARPRGASSGPTPASGDDR